MGREDGKIVPAPTGPCPVHFHTNISEDEHKHRTDLMAKFVTFAPPQWAKINLPDCGGFALPQRDCDSGTIFPSPCPIVTVNDASDVSATSLQEKAIVNKDKLDFTTVFDHPDYKVTAGVWRHYGIASVRDGCVLNIDDFDGKCFCLECYEPVGMSVGASTSRKRHMDSFHEHVAYEGKAAKVVKKSGSAVSPRPGITLNVDDMLGQRTMTLTQKSHAIAAVLKYMIKKLTPPSHFDDEDFQAMLHTIAGNTSCDKKRFPLPTSSQFARRLLPDLYENCKANVKKALTTTAVYAAGGMKIIGGCSTDGWRDRFWGNDYLGVTIQWYTPNFECKTAMLGLEVFPTTEKKSAAVIQEKLEGIFKDEVKLDFDDLIFTTDSGSNFSKKIFWPTRGARKKKLPADDPRHALTEILDEASDVVSRVNHSGIKSQLASVDVAGPKVLVPDVLTRFSSTYLMIQSLINLAPYLRKIITNGKFDKLDYLLAFITTQRIQQLKVLLNALRPFYEATVLMSGRLYPTLNLFYAQRAKLQQHWLSETSDDDSDLAQAIIAGKKEAHETLLRKVGRRNQRLQPSATHLKAAYFDTRLRDCRFYLEMGRSESFRHEMCEKMQKYIHDELTTIVEQHITEEASAVSEEPQNKKACDWWLDVGETSAPTSKVDSIVNQEMKLYATYTTSNVKSRFVANAPSQHDWPVKFWAEFHPQFPYLSMMARRYLSATVSNIPAESLFSMTNLMLSDKRNRMKATTLKMLMYLKQNWEYVNAPFVVEQLLRGSGKKLSGSSVGTSDAAPSLIDEYGTEASAETEVIQLDGDDKNTTDVPERDNYGLDESLQESDYEEYYPVTMIDPTVAPEHVQFIPHSCIYTDDEEVGEDEY